eukprot:648410-Pelagomonas_calceolata.AAC.5
MVQLAGKMISRACKVARGIVSVKMRKNRIQKATTKRVLLVKASGRLTSMPGVCWRALRLVVPARVGGVCCCHRAQRA